MTFTQWWDTLDTRKKHRADREMLSEAYHAARKAALLEAADYVDTNMGGTTASLYLRRMAEGEKG